MAMNNTLRRFSIFLTVCFLATQCFFIDDAWAKKRRRSFSSRKKSSFSKQKSPSKGSSFSLFKKKSAREKTYSSRSKTRNKKGSIFHAHAQKTSRGTSFSQAAKRADSKSKFTGAIKGKQTIKTYRQVVTENTALSEFLTPKNTFSRNNRRDYFYNSHSPSNDYYYRYSSTSYNDPYDNLFFRYVTLTWLFHHWNTIDKSRFDERRLRELESKIEQMEQEGMERDPDYSIPGVEPDLQYSDQELANLQDAKEVMEFESDVGEGEGGFGWVTIFLIGLVVVGGVYFVAVRRY